MKGFDANCPIAPEMPGLTVPVRAGLIAFWVLIFTSIFFLSWHAMKRYWPRFRKFDDSQKSDNASRVNSMLHALLVSPSLIYGYCMMDWGPYLEPLGDPSLLQCVLAISMGYFIADFFVLLRYHPPLWKVFMLHHVTACLPYLTYFFSARCAIGLNILACYMLVEITNVTYNAKQWLEAVGRTRTKLYAFLLYFSAALWLVFRNFSVARCLYYSQYVVIPSAGAAKPCLYPGHLCGYFVNVFCVAGFYVVFVREIADRWQCKGTWLLTEETSQLEGTAASSTNGHSNGHISDGGRAKKEA